MAEVAGFEPTDAGIKTQCLTIWQHLYMAARYPMPTHDIYLEDSKYRDLHYRTQYP